jgi:hypothetical protein
MKKTILFILCLFVNYHISAQKHLNAVQREQAFLVPLKNLNNQLKICLYDERLKPIHTYINNYLKTSGLLEAKIKYLATCDSLPLFDIGVVFNMNGITPDSIVKKSQDKLYDHMTYMKYDLIGCRFPSEKQFFTSTELVTSFKNVMKELGNPMELSEAQDIIMKTLPYDAEFAFINSGSDNITSVENHDTYILNRVLSALYDSYKKDGIVIEYDFTGMILAGNRLSNILAVSDLVEKASLDKKKYKTNFIPMLPNRGVDGMEDIIFICRILNIQPNVYQLHLN